VLGANTEKRLGDHGSPLCYAAMGNSFVIRSDGRVGKCTVALDDDRNTVGMLCDDGSIRIRDARFRPWIRGLFDGDQAALACPLRGLPSVPRSPTEDSIPNSTSSEGTAC
jgi:uncharacterized protein